MPLLFIQPSRLAGLVLLVMAFDLVAIPVISQTSSNIDSFIQIVEKNGPEKVESKVLNSIAMYYAEVNPEIGLQYARQATALAQQQGNRLDMANSMNSMANNWLMMTEMDSAKHYYNTALTIYTEENNKKGMGDIAGNLGHAAYFTGKHDDALAYYFKALSYYEDIGYKEGITTQHSSLANTYMVEEKYPEAIYHDSIALIGFAALGDSVSYAMVLGNLGNIYGDLNQFDKAASYYKEASTIYGRAQQPYGMGRNLINLAALYIDQGQFDSALKVAMEGYTICNTNNFDFCTFYCLSNIGQAYLESYAFADSAKQEYHLVPGRKEDLLRQSIHYLEQALLFTHKLESPEYLDVTHQYLSRAYKYSGQFAKALQHHEIYSSLKDSLASIERAGRIEELTTAREIAVRDKQIELDKLQLKVKRNERIYFIVGLILLAASLAMVYRNAINQRKSNQQLGLLNTQITNTNLQLEDRNEKLNTTLVELKSTQAQLIEVERQKENEILRRRISRDIHDDISSGLSKISWMTELLRDTPDGKHAENDTMLRRIASYSRETVSKLGEIIWSTKPESDNFNSLVSYCREFLNKYLEGLPMKIHIHFPEQEDNIALNPELRRNFYLVLKESVHNAVKYSQATELNVSISLKDGSYTLVVEDNGIGMSVGNESSKGNGLRNMQERMKEVKGTMSIHSIPGQGTRLEFSGPIY